MCKMFNVEIYLNSISECLKIVFICAVQTSPLTTLTIHEQIVSVTLNIFMKNIVLTLMLSSVLFPTKQKYSSY